MGRSVHRLGKSSCLKKKSVLVNKAKNWVWFFLQRNYPFFVCFISCSTLLCIYVFVFSLMSMLEVHGQFYVLIADDLILGVLALYCFVSVWFVGGLTVFHLYLISTNQARFFSFISKQPLITLLLLVWFFLLCFFNIVVCLILFVMCFSDDEWEFSVPLW